MKDNKISSKNNLSRKLLFLEKKQFTGRLDIDSIKGKKWKIYFCLSRIVWADGGSHPNRSWRRSISKFSSLPDLSEINTLNLYEFECWNYLIISILLKRSVINQEQVKEIVENKIIEVLFDSTCYHQLLITSM